MKELRESAILIVLLFLVFLGQYITIYGSIVGAILTGVKILFFPPFLPETFHSLLGVSYVIIFAVIIIKSF